MPLSQQTWTQSATGTPGGSGDTVQEVLAAVKTLIDADSNWNASENGTAATQAYLEITSAAGLGANVQTFKILLAQGNQTGSGGSNTLNPAWTLGGSGNWAEAGNLDHTVNQGTQRTNGTDDIYVGYVAPPSDGSSATASINTGNIFTATGPYGGTASSDTSRFSSYVKCVHDVSDTGNNFNISRVWLLSCPEMLTIAFEDTLGRIKFVHAGAIIAPITDTAGETISNSVGRIFGMCTAKADSGIEKDPSTPNDLFWSNVSAAAAASPAGGGFTPLISNTGSHNGINSVLVVHYPESNALDVAFNFWSGLVDHNAGNTVVDDGGSQPGSFMDVAGNIVSMPIPIVDGTTKSSNGTRISRQLIGIMRQVKMANPSVCRAIVQNAEGNVIGFTFTGSRSEAAQGFLFTND